MSAGIRPCVHLHSARSQSCGSELQVSNYTAHRNVPFEKSALLCIFQFSEMTCSLAVLAIISLSLACAAALPLYNDAISSLVTAVNSSSSQTCIGRCPWCDLLAC